MKISEMIKELEKVLREEGDLRVTVFDNYTANEGYDYDNEELWTDAYVDIEYTEDDDGNELEKVCRVG